MILPDEQLEALLDKLSGFVKDGERILILARYHHLRPKFYKSGDAVAKVDYRFYDHSCQQRAAG